MMPLKLQSRLLAPVALQAFALTSCASLSIPEQGSWRDRAMQVLNVGEFNPKKYQPPKEGGTIVAEYTHFDPKNTKTVIYLPDHHAYAGQEGLNVQKDLYAILEDLMSRTGKLSIVAEDMLPDTTQEEYVAEFDRGKILQNKLIHLSGDPRDLLSTVLGTFRYTTGSLRDAVDPKQFRNWIGAEAISALPTFVTAYSDRVNLIPSKNPDLDRSACENYEPIAAAFLLGITDPKELPLMCFVKQDDGKMTGFNFKDLMDNAETPNSLARDCICTHFISEAECSKQREHEVPEFEVKAALNNDSQITIIIAGARHTYASMQVLQNAGVNYMLIRPESITGNSWLKPPETYKPSENTQEWLTLCRNNNLPAHKAVWMNIPTDSPLFKH